MNQQPIIHSYTESKKANKKVSLSRRAMFGLGALTLATGAAGEHALQDVQHNWSQDKEFSQPASKIQQDLNAGKLDPNKVTTFHIDRPEAAASFAGDEAKAGDVRAVQDMVTAQDGPALTNGENVILPNDDLNLKR